MRSIAGVSGGRTSAYMATLLPKDTILSFQNTGREHPATLDFLRELEQFLGREIVWLEWRPPAEVGGRPRDFRFERVTFETADRKGEVFRGLMEALAAFRRVHKGLPPIAPWARARLCTSYLKIRVQEHFVASLKWDEYISYIGLRADEPNRVAVSKARATEAKTIAVPLFDLGVTKDDVNTFWSRQSFDLRIQPHQGNCTACFLKDQADTSRVMMEPETDPEFWEEMQESYPNFGGEAHAGYANLRAEGPMRLSIEASLRGGASRKSLIAPEGFDPKRFRLVVIQEDKRIQHGATPFSCNCEIGGEVDDERE